MARSSIRKFAMLAGAAMLLLGGGAQQEASARAKATGVPLNACLTKCGKKAGIPVQEQCNRRCFEKWKRRGE